MKVKNIVKRLGAVATAGAMLGATAMGALAADLGNYPDMFVSDGTFNGYFVVGEAAASVDNLAMTDIAAGMKVRSGGTSTVIEGDAWMVGSGVKKYEMSNTNSTPVGEQIYDIEQFIGEDEMAALADGTFSTTGSSSSYTQYLYFDTTNNAQNEIVVFTENDKDVTSDFFFVKNGVNIGEYVVEFSSSPESSIQNTAGSASTTGTVLDDYENTKLTMLGMEFDIVLARRPESTPEDSIQLTLMGGAVRGALLEGESTSLELGGVSYDVTLSFVDETYVKFVVNGEQTDKLQKGDTFQLADDNEIGVSERLYQNYAGGVHSADFFLGASKIVLRDNVITNTEPDTVLKVGTETISGADVIVEGTDDNTTFTLSKIRVNMTAQDDYFVPVNGKLSEAIVEQGDDKELVFTNNWDIEYLGLTEEETHEVKLFSTTDRKYKLRFNDGDNNPVDLPLFYANDTTSIQFSDDGTKKVVLYEGVNITKNDYFVVTGGSATSGTAKSYALQYKGSDKTSTTSPKIKFKNLGSSENLDYSVNTNSANDVATIKLGGYSFLVQNLSVKTSNDFAIEVDQNGGGAIAALPIDIVDSGGLRIYVASIPTVATDNMVDYSADASVMGFTTDNTNDFDNSPPPVINLTVDGTTNTEVTFGTLTFDDETQALLTPEGEENIAYGYTTMGGKITYATPSGSPPTFIYDYPAVQRLPQVYVTSGSVATLSGGGDMVSVAGLVGASKLDSEIADEKAQNLIVVGGPCVNVVAAKLLGNPADCTEGFRAGVARVKMFEHANGNVAMLVAGFSGQDTRNAGGFLATRWEEMSGEEVELEGSTSSNLVVSAPQAVVAVVEEVVAEE